MKLCALKASDFETFWGEPRNATIIGQMTDCSSFLLLTTETELYLEPSPNMGDYDFTFCQAWGLRITPDVVRRALQEIRNAALQTITHTFPDGRVVQVRPQDLANFQAAISLGAPNEWVMENNAVSVLTVEDMQSAIGAGILQGKAIWQTYIDGLKQI